MSFTRIDLLYRIFDIRKAKFLANASNVSFGVALVGVGLGIAGLVAGKPAKEAPVAQKGLRPELAFDAGFDSYAVDARWRF